MRRLHLFLLATAFLLGIVWNIQAQNFAVEFFGNVDDHVTAPDSDSLDIDGKAFTMEAWVFPTEIRDPEGIVINKEDSYEMAVWKGELKWAIAAPRWAWFGGGPVELNKWSHIAVTYDGDISMGWVNGKKVSEDKQNKGNIIPRDGDASPFSVGWRAWGHHGPFSGFNAPKILVVAVSSSGLCHGSYISDGSLMVFSFVGLVDEMDDFEIRRHFDV